jgi:hypothetical protein
VSEVRRRRQQCFDLFLAENDREFLFVPRQRYAFDIDAPVQGVAVEKAQPTNGLNVRRSLHMLLVQQVQLPRADLFGSQLIWRAVEMFGEISHRTDVAFHGSRGVVADAEIFQHSLLQ